MIDWKKKPNQNKLIKEAITLAEKAREKRQRGKINIHTTLSPSTLKIINKLMNIYNIENKNKIIEIALFYMDLVKKKYPEFL